MDMFKHASNYGSIVGAVGSILLKSIDNKDFSSTGIATSQIRANLACMNLLFPEQVSTVHMSYLEAGSEIITTNSLTCNRLTQRHHALKDKVYELNKLGAKIAVDACLEYMKKAPNSGHRFVLGSIGSVGLRIDLCCKSPAYLTAVEEYKVQIRGLMDGGVHGLLIETMTGLNDIKASMEAADAIFGSSNSLPVFLSIVSNSNDPK
ncbi:hypothetical protein H4219_003611 [Mycoemilia scoparia]|uniref:Hcy-binding domain-containing protein n=1 Tax=Mycoemilia scoparia TaxID=417184 RepID=A0A9W7ZUH9_9FUNG|nr:hypothetical protein H4219_003611 [Mycoemilia scoparia]